MVSATREGFTAKIHFRAVLRCPRLLTGSFPLLQFLRLPVNDLLNDEPLMIRNSKDLFYFQLLGVIPACSGAPESRFLL